MVGQMIQCSVQVCLNLIKIFLTNTSTIHYKEESYRHSLFYLWSACWVQQRVVEGEDFPLYKLDRYRYVQHWSVWFLSLIWGRVKFVHSGQQHVMIFEGNYFYHNLLLLCITWKVRLHWHDRDLEGANQRSSLGGACLILGKVWNRLWDQAPWPYGWCTGIKIGQSHFEPWLCS